MTTLQIFGVSHHVILKFTLYKAKEPFPLFFTLLGFKILHYHGHPVLTLFTKSQCPT